MRIGWREFLRQRFKKASKYHSIGIEFGDTVLYISTFRNSAKELIWVKQHVIPITDWVVKLKEYVAEQNLANTPCRVALSIARYQLLQVDKPAVAKSELTQALQWSVGELIPGEDELILDYFDYPASSSAAPKLNVVAIAKKEIVEICLGIGQAGLKLEHIGIEELATCDLLPQSDDAVMTVFQEAGDQVCLNIVKQNKLFFSRRLRGYENMFSFSPEELQMGVGDTLSVEIQRSVDYFERQLRQTPIKKILISVDSPHQDELAVLIAQLTSLSVEAFKPAIHLADGMQLSVASYASLGAAIGHEASDVEAS
ncbi:MAG: MSHA biogenesis protein MshI [Paraglaciecola sp.]|jgi:MSHA biogenesis protein MshI